MKKLMNKVLLGSSVFVIGTTVVLAGDFPNGPPAIPEPSMWPLLALAGAVIYFMKKRKK